MIRKNDMIDEAIVICRKNGIKGTDIITAGKILLYAYELLNYSNKAEIGKRTPGTVRKIVG